MALDDTHDPALSSWVESAQATDADFPVQNLPLGVFTVRGDSRPRIGVAIGDRVLDLRACHDAGLFEVSLAEVGAACASTSLNALMALGKSARVELRRAVSGWLRHPSEYRSRVEPQLRSTQDITLQLPAAIGDYTDFYASIFHATNVGSMLRPDEPLLPNYKHVPIGYHGRASSIVVSGTPVKRPRGQTKPDTAMLPVVGPSGRLDYELEVAAFIGPGNALGSPIPIESADDHVFGLCLLNDWSARDIQQWEYQPLGPFLAKSFVTSISPWVITIEALEPFRAPLATRPDGDPPPADYLSGQSVTERGAFDVRLEVTLRSARMRAAGMPPHVLSRSSLKHLYWTIGQLVTHHASNGCNLRPGDLVASGTVSGPTRESRGCLLELTWRGTEPFALPTGEERRFLEDGDEVVFRGWCERRGATRIGFGECSGLVVAAD
jgi:fumarylacetoacetase